MNEKLQFSKSELELLAEKFSFDIMQEWDFEKNDKEFPDISILKIGTQSHKKIWWKCLNFNHSWLSSLRHKNDGSSCAVCKNKQLCIGFNDFATKLPELLKEWNQSIANPDPSTVLFSTSKVEIQWPCTNGHFFTTTPHFIARGRKCNYCNGTKILQGFNDLASKCPDSKEWWDYDKNEKTPEEVRYGSDVKVWWKCPLSHSYEASINHFRHGRRCSICSGKTVDKTTKLSNTHPLLTLEWNYDKNTDSTPETISAGHDKKVWWECSQCQHSWESYVYNRTNKLRPQGCPKCAKGSTSSKGEKQIVDFLQNNGINKNEIITHKIIENSEKRKFEIDAYIPHLKIGIEFNGVYYHSEKFVNKDYHHNKLQACKEQEIDLIQIWEDDWNYKREIVKNMLAHKLSFSQQEKIYARNAIIKEINHDKAFSFLSKNHIQGAVSASKYFGLFSKTNQLLLAVMSIRYENNKKTFNIVRYATSAHIIGGFTKIIKYIEKTYSFEKFITFSDNCISNGELYSKNGFIKDRELKPDYMYLVKKQKREHKFKYRKIKFKTDPNLLWEDGKTEKQLAVINGLLRVYDAGKIKWVRYSNEYRKTN